MAEDASQIPIPGEYAASRKSAPDRGVKGERRVVTILFCDVKGSTEMAESLDPEDWAEIMHEAFDYLIAPIHRYGGTLARLMGDAVLAFFGAPEAHEDDPQRAILAGLGIIEGIRPFCDRIREEFKLDFGVRVGINTGPVVVGDIGSELAMEYTAMGDAVNLAARMEQTAQPGTVQVAEATHKLVAPLFEFESLGGFDIKGKKDPLQAYRVVKPKAEPGPLRGLEGLISPLVGRSHEFEHLEHALRDLRQGRGSIACLLGEAGLGKSRMIDELRLQWEHSNGHAGGWIQTGGISYDMARPYSLFQQIFRKLCSIAEHDSPQVARERIQDLCQDFQPEATDDAARAAELILAFQADGRGPIPEGEALKRELFAAMLAAWRKPASLPLVMVLDDLHWADLASIELLEHLFQLADEIPILFLCALRPYRQSPGWRAKVAAETSYPHRYREIQLDPLSPAESDSLVDNLLTVAELPTDLRAMIQDKGEGNPFFVEEIIRTLIQAGAIERDPSGKRWQATSEIENIALPDNLQAMLVARMDRLERDVRRTLQLASVIGRSFFFRVLARIAEMQEALNQHLNTLERTDLIREAARAPELEYAFRHDLTRDAAYHSILRRERRDYHHKVGEAIESLFPDRLEEEAHRLAYHFREGGDEARALKYYQMAGDVAARLYANQEAITQYKRALEVAEKGGAQDSQLIHLHTRLGRTYEVCGQFQEAINTYAALERLGHDAGRKNLELAALLAQATVLSTPTVLWKSEQAERVGQRALALAQELNDPRSEAKALWNLMLVENYLERDQSKAIEFGERSLAIARQHDLPEEQAYALHDLARAYIQTGRLEDGAVAYEQSRELWQQLDNLPLLTDNLASSAMIHFYRGDLQTARGLTEQALEISRRIGNPWGVGYGLMGQGAILLEMGEIGLAIQALEDCIPVSREANFTAGTTFAPAYAAWAYYLLGDLNRAQELLKPAIEGAHPEDPSRVFPLALLAVTYARQGQLAEVDRLTQGIDISAQHPFPDPIFMAWSAVLDSELALTRGDAQRTLALIVGALGHLRETGVEALNGWLLLNLARGYRLTDRMEQARAALRQGREWAARIGAPIVLLELLLESHAIEGQAGQAEEAAAHAEEARRWIGYLADRIHTTELRGSFLARPDIKALG